MKVIPLGLCNNKNYIPKNPFVVGTKHWQKKINFKETKHLTKKTCEIGFWHEVSWFWIGNQCKFTRRLHIFIVLIYSISFYQEYINHLNLSFLGQIALKWILKCVVPIGCRYENCGNVAITLVIGEVESWTPRNRLRQPTALLEKHNICIK